MRCVAMILCVLVSFSYAQTLKLCDVPKAEKPIISVDQEYLLKTLYGPFVVAHGASDKKFIPTNIHPFIYAAHKSYAEHRPLIISPDAVWLLISQAALTHISQNPKAHPAYSKALNDLPELIVPEADSGQSSNEFWLSRLNSFSRPPADGGEGFIGDFLKPVFSTSDPNIQNAFKVCRLTSKSETFEFGLFSLCGIPEISLEGSVKDWETVHDKLSHLEEFGMSDWAAHLKPVLKEFIAAAKGRVNKKFWNSFYKFNNECGDGSVSGWILNFFPFNAKGALRHLVKAHSNDVLKNIPDSDPNMSFPGGRNYLPFKQQVKNRYVDMRFEGGFMGISQDPQSLALKAEINWAVVSSRASGHLSVWQQSILRDKTIGKEKLGAAFSATYIDIDNFKNEADSGLKNLKLLEYAIVKQAVRGEFLNELTSLPNFKELECHDWNIDESYLPYISKLRNENFTFSKTTRPDFFKFLPKTAKSLVFKNLDVKAEWLANIKLESLEKLYFENCRFEENAFSSLKAKIAELHIHRSKEISFKTLEEINKLKSLSSLAVTSCKLKNFPALKLAKLTKLNLNSNLLENTAVFNMLKNLKSLNIANNRFHGKIDFNGLSGLEELIAHHNHLSELELDLPELTSLHASNNLLTKLPKVNSKVLKSLIVEQNLILEAEIPDFLSSSLEVLILENVELSRENTKAIGMMKKLKELSLKNCALVNNDISELQKLENLKSLKIWTNKKLTDECKGAVIRLFSMGTQVSIFDCGFSSSVMEEFARHREKYN